MEIQTAIEILTYHQEWRLGKRDDMIHEPKKLTEALDILLTEVKKLHKPDVMPSLPDIYRGKLNAKRIKKYKKLAQLYNIQEGTVRDLFCSGADWFKKVTEGNCL